ncbi:hypothetical protein OAN307_c15500 [Octadecabacter antarcticus 307]|uniref:Uncharacterized protein n=1 Tax=Octadecabacter antarcticus 307 TaxID=391626 RepID=M9R622_9RHOB|nr:hypothetical protein [Octadecabacter antarcticus]AGI67223.1 hypothetical protein OAN307_c15500 [Octadecabacter antarcticus 307]
MALTISFHMVGVDWVTAFVDSGPYFTTYAGRDVAQECPHSDLKKLYLMKGFHAGTVFCNSVHVRSVDGTDPVAVGAATREGRRRCLKLSQFLKSEVVGIEGAFMSLLLPTVGVRVTR